MRSRSFTNDRKDEGSRTGLSGLAFKSIMLAAAVAGGNLALSAAAAQSQEIIVTAPAANPFPLVVLTYPATISEAAFQPLKEAYQKSKLGFGCANPLFKCPRQDAAFEMSLAKTAYLVQDVHASLQAR